ncbi:tetratricopeptide repeat protein [Patescibacteria group bacterium]|nr:tetratricopeptide repeat protein [Patescibacteria group bacterium]
MLKEQKNNLVIAGLVIAILIVIFIVLPSKTNEQNSDKNVEVITLNEEAVTTTDVTIDVDGNATIQGGAIQIDTQPQDTTVQAPRLDREISIPDYFDSNASEIMRTKIADAILNVKNSKRSFDNWLTLGNLYNQIQDYEGALEVYEYINILSPENNIGYTNVGNIYHYNLQDFEKAETNYLLSITKDVSSENAYIELHTLYKNVYKTDTSSAVDILLEGLENTDNNPDLMVMLASYCKENGDKENARSWYEAARDRALKDGKQSFADLLQEEIDNL